MPGRLSSKSKKKVGKGKKDHQQVSINFPANCCNDSNYEGRRWGGAAYAVHKSRAHIKAKGE